MSQEPDETTAAEAEERQPAKVWVPTRQHAHGHGEFVGCDPEAAWMWDSRRWERLS